MAPNPVLSRRRFLQLSALAALVSACDSLPVPRPTGGPIGSSTPGAPTPSPGPTGADLPFDVWEAVRAALRSSPDHLVGQADALAQNGDAEAIFRFVRDEIATLPSQRDGFGNAETAVRWGTRATLRCGAGTPREKAELLAELLRRTGVTTEIRTGQLRSEVASPTDLLYRAPARRFAPAVDAKTVDGWLHDLGLGGTSAALARIDADGTKRRALAADLKTRLPATSAVPFDPSFNARVPIVALRSGGNVQYLNPLVPNGELGQSYLAGDPVVAAPPTTPLRVDIGLLISRSDDPNVRQVVAEGSWTADQLVGRLVQIGFAPVGGLAAISGRSADEVELFQPYLAIRSPELSVDESRGLAAGGRSFSIGGRILDVDADGTPTVNGVPMAARPSDPAGAASVVSIDAIEPRVDAFPMVRLAIAPRDSGGAIVTGLGAADILVEEDGRSVAYLLAENQPRRPRVLLLLDTSGSIPAVFRGNAAADLSRNLATAILAIDPAAQFRVAGINYGTATPSGDWVGDPATVASNVLKTIGDGSELWRSLGEATTLGASAIVVITDGDATDPVAQAMAARARVAAGPPVIVLGVGSFKPAFGKEVATLTGGASTLASASGPAVDAVAKALAAIRARPYVVEYRAKASGPGNRTVRVTIGSTSANGSYAVPAAADRLPAPTVAGLYLRLRVAGGEEITRTIAGLDHRRSYRRDDPIPAGIADEVLGALFGGALLSVEANGATLSAWLDGFLAAKLALRPVWAAVRARDSPALLDALRAAGPIPPPALLAMSAPLPDDHAGQTVTFPSGLRCTLYREQLVFGTGRRHSIDVLPTAAWRTAAPSAADAFGATLERTAQLSVAEAALFASSTSSVLANRPLQLVAAGAPAPRSGPLAALAPDLDEYSSDDRIAPTDGGPAAFWVVRHRTGELLAILPDGTGGGGEVEPDAGVEKAAAVAGILGSLAEMGFVGGAFIALQKAIARETMRLAAWILTIGEETEGSDPNLGDPLKGLGCDLAKVAIGAMSHTTEMIELADKVVEAAGGHGIPCPG